jgi:hypothetical protein
MTPPNDTLMMPKFSQVNSVGEVIGLMTQEKTFEEAIAEAFVLDAKGTYGDRESNTEHHLIEYAKEGGQILWSAAFLKSTPDYALVSFLRSTVCDPF